MEGDKVRRREGGEGREKGREGDKVRRGREREGREEKGMEGDKMITSVAVHML